MAAEGMLGSASFSSTALSSASTCSPLFMLSWSCWRRCTSALRFSKSFWLKGKAGRGAGIRLAVGLVKHQDKVVFNGGNTPCTSLPHSSATPEHSQGPVCWLGLEKEAPGSAASVGLGQSRGFISMMARQPPAAAAAFLPPMIIYSLRTTESWLKSSISTIIPIKFSTRSLKDN